MPFALLERKEIVVFENIDNEILSYIIDSYNLSRFTSEHGYELLGEGEEAYVYGFKQFAIKVKKKDRKNKNILFNDADIYKKLLNNNPLFPKMYAYKEDEFVIMEKVEGKTLGELGMRALEELQFFPPNLKQQVIHGYEDAFSKGIIPDDVHLNNILITNDHSTLKVVDVGRFRFVHKKYHKTTFPDFRKDDRLYTSLLKTG